MFARRINLRSVAAWTVFAALLAGLPLHACMPLWCDGQVFDVCARVLLRGGVLYREVFDFATPGMVLTQAAIRGLLGWRTEALRLIDVLLVLGSVALLAGFVLPRPRMPGGRVWAA